MLERKTKPGRWVLTHGELQCIGDLLTDVEVGLFQPIQNPAARYLFSDFQSALGGLIDATIRGDVNEASSGQPSKTHSNRIHFNPGLQGKFFARRTVEAGIEYYGSQIENDANPDPANIERLNIIRGLHSAVVNSNQSL